MGFRKISSLRSRLELKRILVFFHLALVSHPKSTFFIFMLTCFQEEPEQKQKLFFSFFLSDHPPDSEWQKKKRNLENMMVIFLDGFE